MARLPYTLRQKWRVVADGITEENGREVTIADIANFEFKRIPYLEIYVTNPESKVFTRLGDRQTEKRLLSLPKSMIWMFLSSLETSEIQRGVPALVASYAKPLTGHCNEKFPEKEVSVRDII